MFSGFIYIAFLDQYAVLQGLKMVILPFLEAFLRVPNENKSKSLFFVWGFFSEKRKDYYKKCSLLLNSSASGSFCQIASTLLCVSSILLCWFEQEAWLWHITRTIVAFRLTTRLTATQWCFDASLLLKMHALIMPLSLSSQSFALGIHLWTCVWNG